MYHGARSGALRAPDLAEQFALLLESSGKPLEGSCALSSWRPLESLLEALGGLLEVLGGLVRASWELLEASWRPLREASRGLLEASCTMENIT